MNTERLQQYSRKRLRTGSAAIKHNKRGRIDVAVVDVPGPFFCTESLSSENSCDVRLDGSDYIEGMPTPIGCRINFTMPADDEADFFKELPTSDPYDYNLSALFGCTESPLSLLNGDGDDDDDDDAAAFAAIAEESDASLDTTPDVSLNCSQASPDRDERQSKARIVGTFFRWNNCKSDVVLLACCDEDFRQESGKSRCPLCAKNACAVAFGECGHRIFCRGCAVTKVEVASGDACRQCGHVGERWSVLYPVAPEDRKEVRAQLVSGIVSPKLAPKPIYCGPWIVSADSRTNRKLF